MMNLIKSQLDPNGQLQLDEMRRCGCSHDEIINHFMNREKNKKGQKRNEFGRKMYELTKGKKLTKKELEKEATCRLVDLHKGRRG